MPLLSGEEARYIGSMPWLPPQEGFCSVSIRGESPSVVFSPAAAMPQKCLLRGECPWQTWGAGGGWPAVIGG
jgi:hypothetical protein